MNDETMGLAEYIEHQVKAGIFNPGETIILCPRRQFGYSIRDELRKRSIECHSYFHEEALEGNPKDPEKSMAQESFVLLKIFENLNDFVSLRCWLGFNHNDLRAKEYERLRNASFDAGLTPYQLLEMMLDGEIKIKYTTGILDRYRLLKKKLLEMNQMSVSEIVEYLFPVSEDWARPIRELIEEHLEPEWTTTKLVGFLTESITQPELPNDVDYIRVMSLHKSKGLNADNVIIMGFVEGLLPSIKEDLSLKERISTLEEQRRLLFVGMTRARKTLIFSSVEYIERQLVHSMGCKVYGGTPTHAKTITSTFQSQFGPTSPEPEKGEDWLSRMIS